MWIKSTAFTIDKMNVRLVVFCVAGVASIGPDEGASGQHLRGLQSDGGARGSAV